MQAVTLPDALAGRDLIGRGQTGSGKTLAFGLPMLARISPEGREPGRPQGLVLVPTRELATQVRDALEPLGHPLGLRFLAVFGGMPIDKQIRSLRAGVDIVVATPGRLLDLVRQEELRLDGVTMSVLDEADLMADMGFMPDITAILDQTPAGTQRLLFSATLDGAVGELVTTYLTNPVAHAISPAASPVEAMAHQAFVVAFADKVPVLAEIAGRPARTLVFVKTKEGADTLAKDLSERGVAAESIHGNRSQQQRNRALAAFSSGRSRVLVATDVAARGIDVPGVDLVVHADPPKDPKDYLHRSGRTARAGQSGLVLSVLLHHQVRPHARMLQRAGVAVEPESVVPGHEAVREIAESGEPVLVVAEVEARKPRPHRAGGTHRSDGPKRRPYRSAGESPSKQRREDGPQRNGWSSPARGTDAVTAERRPPRPTVGGRATAGERKAGSERASARPTRTASGTPNRAARRDGQARQPFRSADVRGQRQQPQAAPRPRRARPS